MKVYSIIRQEEYKKLKNVTLQGEILDIGGNIDSDYHDLIIGEHHFTSVNIDPKHGCDLVFDIQKKFPLASNVYDGVISMNVFEHIYGFQNAFSESARVLKDGGTFIFAVPFMHHIHGCPDDYMRYTKSTLKKILSDNKFKSFHIDEIGLGIFSLNYQTISGVLPTFLKPVFKWLATSIDGVLLWISKRYRDTSERIPLGYFVVAQK